MFELESNLEEIRSESLRLAGLMEQSLLITHDLGNSTPNDVKSLEREMWKLERECRLFSAPLQSKSLPTSPPPSDLRREILTTKEQLAELQRQIHSIAQSPLDSPTFKHSRQSTAEHHYHHYYYHVPEFQKETTYNSPAILHDTPLHTKFFRELPTPPPTASSTSSTRHERLSSSFSTWPQEPDSLSDLPRTPSSPRISDILLTPLKRSSSHDSIFEPSSFPFPRSSPLSSATSSPTYLSASAYLRQNHTSSLLLLSSARGKQSRGLSSRKSFWNLWEKTARGKGVSGLRNAGSVVEGGKGVVVCTEIDVGMLRDALEG
jgi:hypothetical protein